MDTDLILSIVAVVSGLAALGISYGLALTGEPQSQWLWCSVIGAC